MANEIWGGGGAYSGGGGITKSCSLIVQYYANGYNGSNASNPPSSTVRNYTGAAVAITLTAPVEAGDSMSNPGYVFVGWADNNQSSPTVDYNPGERVRATWDKEGYGTVRKYLYAIWTADNVITYHPDENSDQVNQIYQVKMPGQTATLKGAIFTRTGHTQIGWATEAGGTTAYSLEGSYSSDSPLNLYPVWQANTYTITYNANDGEGEMSTQTVTFGSTFTPSECTFTRVGYTFSSWNESSDGKSVRWRIKEYTFDRTEDLAFYAIWKGNEYTVTYNANSPNAEGTMAPSTAVFGDEFITRRNQFTLFGLSFKGWNTAADGSGDDWLPSGVSMDTYKRTESGIWDVANDVTLYAQWDPHVYPYGRIFFNGDLTTTYGIVVEQLPSYYYAERAFTHKQVNGKNGDVLLDNGRYENVRKVYKVACYDPNRNFYESAVALSTWLHNAGSDYIRLEDSYEPTSYRMAVYEETNEIENIEGQAGRCEITFNCKPQRFLLSGDDEILVESSGSTIYNPTVFDAKPLIRVQGTGSITIDGRTIEIGYNDNDLLIDCETQNAKDLAGTNMNYFVYCEEYPILKPGFSTITYDEGIESVKIIPRWWIL